MYRAQEVGPEHPLTASPRGSRRRPGCRCRRCYVIPDMSPNAFATGRNPEHAAVAATEGILRLLSENELEGVIAHELAHVKHRDILISTVAATLAAAIMFLAHMARFAAFFGGGSRDDREGAEPDRDAGDGDPRAVRRDADSDGDLAPARVRGRSRRRRRSSGSPTGLANALAPHRRRPPNRSRWTCNPATAHMFIMNPFARQGLMSPVLDASADRGADQGADGDAARAVRRGTAVSHAHRASIPSRAAVVFAIAVISFV